MDDTAPMTPDEKRIVEWLRAYSNNCWKHRGWRVWRWWAHWAAMVALELAADLVESGHHRKDNL